MKRVFTISIMILFISMIAAPISFATARERRGLLIIAHGSHSKKWNDNIKLFEKNVRAIIKKNEIKSYDYVKACFLETKPFINEGVAWLEEKGAQTIYVIPLFLVPSAHLSRDIPAALGIYSDKKIIHELREEGLRIVDSNVKIVMGPSLNYGSVIKEIMLSRIKELSRDPKNEGLILLLHGSKGYAPPWIELANEVSSYITGLTGITCSDYAFVQVGQSFKTDAIPIIIEASEKKKRVIVAGVYLAKGAKSMLKGLSNKSKNLLKGKNIVYGEKGLLPDKRIAEWVVKRAMEFALSRRK